MSAPPAFGAYLFKEDVHVHPEKTCLAFCEAAKSLGATVSEHAQVDTIRSVTWRLSGYVMVRPLSPQNM